MSGKSEKWSFAWLTKLYHGIEYMDILDADENETWSSGASFTLRNRLYRLGWLITWKLLASWTPPPMHGWRLFLVRLFGGKTGRTGGIYPSARIWSPANFELGEHAYVGPSVKIYSMAKITFAPYALASQGAHICAGTHDINDPHFQLRARPIEIGYRAWIAAEAFVGPGVRVGDGAVLGARGCAFRDLEAWMVYAGNPARPIKPRNVRFDKIVEPGRT